MTLKLLPCVFAALGMLAACSPEPKQPVKDKARANESEIIVPPEANLEANAASAGDEAPGVGVNLAPDELTLVLPNGASRHVRFGIAKADAVQMLGTALGHPVEQAENQDCGAGALGYAAFRDGLSLYFQDGKFAGWDLDGRENGKFATGNGIAIGMTRKALEAAAGSIDVGETSIGNEFMAGDLSGLLSSPAPDGKVTNLWAGVTCIAR
ncbi:hypothetical protein J2W22_002061 [Sphingomonas kyeonggiensis]|uniref:hypothetical protein n=1 Tax=Sphingomonas kyeonggiensis TaxID=1268553 RepID=UPI002785D7B4|nr:hypothetical protein [Sphingomonas kyeonggiensis]MDQ0249997.1 hypothetical protein [Sphingomonas kyeonggiensis]